MILEGRESGIDPARAGDRLPYRTLLRLPQTWGIVIGKTLSDPVWFFITDWFAIYLVSRNYQLEDSLMAFWVPFLAADLGNFAGGGLSSWLICARLERRRGAKARRRARRRRHDAPGANGVRRLLRGDGGLLCGRHVLVCGALDDDPQPAG